MLDGLNIGDGRDGNQPQLWLGCLVALGKIEFEGYGVVVDVFLVDQGLGDAPEFLFGDFLDVRVFKVSGLGIETYQPVGFVESVQL